MRPRSRAVAAALAGALVVSISGSAQAAANVHRATFDTVLDEVLPDGSTRTVVPRSRSLKGSWSPVSLDGRIASTQWKACTSDMSGTHTYRLSMTVKTKQTLDDSDPAAFIARLERTQTVTCP